MTKYYVVLAAEDDDSSVASRSYLLDEQRYHELAEILGEPSWEMYAPADVRSRFARDLFPDLITVDHRSRP